MYCTKCGNTISDNDKFCRNCGSPINVNNNEISNKETNNVLLENDCTRAELESVGSIIIKVIGFTLLGELIGIMEFSPMLMSTMIGIGILLLIFCLSHRAYIGDCPYCGTRVKSANKAGFICPRCRNNIAVKDGKFMKIKK